MHGVIHQINISHGGIPKLPIAEAHVGKRGIRGDSWAHPRFHGGPKQALLLIALEDLHALSELGFPVYPGALGENLTVTGLPFREIRFGDRFRVGNVVVEITKLRQPCRSLDSIKPGIQLEMYDTKPGAPLWGRGGFYAKVTAEGIIRVGDTIATANPDE